MIVKEPRCGGVFVNILHLVTVIVQPAKILKICFYKTNKGSTNIQTQGRTKVVSTVKAKGCFKQQWDYAVYTGLLKHNSRFIFSYADKLCIKFNGQSFKDFDTIATSEHLNLLKLITLLSMTHPKNF